MTSLGGCPPWAVLKDMIDAADSDRNGQVILMIGHMIETITIRNAFPMLTQTKINLFIFLDRFSRISYANDRIP